MDVIPQDGKRRITGREDLVLSFDNSGLYLIKIVGRIKSKKELQGTQDENLLIEIDTRKFPSDSPATFSGSKLKGLKETIFFILPLNNGRHTVSLIADQGADLESFQVSRLLSDSTLEINVNDAAEDGDRRPWVTFILVDLSLASITPTVTYSRQKRDSDDIKIVIDGKPQGNIFRTIKHFLWHFAGSLLSKGNSKTETEIFTTNFSQGLHYIEFWADRMPVLKNIKLNFGVIPSVYKRIPTIDDPDWTGNFDDDTETTILARAIYGEVGGESEKAKIAVGWAIRNRVEDELQRFGRTYHEVVLAKGKFEPFSNSKPDIFKKITNPPLDNIEEKQAWEENYHIAEQVLARKAADPTKGANHSYAPTLNDTNHSYWAKADQYTTQIGGTKFYKL